MVRRYGRWALVTGAAQGIGAAFAEELARARLSLLLLDVQEEPLREKASELSRRHGVEVLPLACDLRRRDFYADLRPALEEREIGLLVCNAGTGYVGPFFEGELEEMVDMVHLNCRSTLILTHRLGARMKARGRGAILILSSMSGSQGTAGVSAYAATKAYGRVLAESLWGELEGSGVDLLAVSPGATRTPALLADEPELEGAVGLTLSTPEEVAKEALAALGRGPNVIPGRASRVVDLLLSRLLPRRLAIRLLRKSMADLYPGRLKR